MKSQRPATRFSWCHQSVLKYVLLVLLLSIVYFIVVHGSVLLFSSTEEALPKKQTVVSTDTVGKQPPPSKAIVKQKLQYKDVYPSIDNTSDFSLKQWNKSESILVYIHIGKSGGTTFGDLIKKQTTLTQFSVKENNGAFPANLFDSIEQVETGIITRDEHFDYQCVQRIIQTAPLGLQQVSLLTFLRDPVNRAISQFYFAKKLNFVKKLRMYNQTVEEFFYDYQSMGQFEQTCRDGEAALFWLAGRHPAGWVNSCGVELPKEIAFSNFTCRLGSSFNYEQGEQLFEVSKKNLRDNFLWFGIVEMWTESIELLNYQTGLSLSAETKSNVGTGYPKCTHVKDEVDFQLRNHIASLMPWDTMLYHYADMLFIKRYKTCVARGNIKLKFK